MSKYPIEYTISRTGKRDETVLIPDIEREPFLNRLVWRFAFWLNRIAQAVIDHGPTATLMTARRKKYGTGLRAHGDKLRRRYPERMAKAERELAESLGLDLH